MIAIACTIRCDAPGCSSSLEGGVEILGTTPPQGFIGGTLHVPKAADGSDLPSPWRVVPASMAGPRRGSVACSDACEGALRGGA